MTCYICEDCDPSHPCIYFDTDHVGDAKFLPKSCLWSEPDEFIEAKWKRVA